MKRFVKALGLTAAMSLALVGCSNDEGSSSDGGKVTLTAWAWNVNVGALNDAVKMYEEENPNVDLKVEDIGRLDVYDKLSTGLAAGGVGLPDIVLVEDDRIQGYVEAFPKGFLNLSEKGFTEHEDKFPDFKKELASFDGNFYAMPFDAGPGGMFYRRSLFEQAGVNAEDIKTWDDFLEAGKKIKDATGSYAMPLDKFKDDPTFRMMLNQLGVYYFDENGNIDLTSPKAVEAMEKLKAFADADLIKDVDGWNGVVSSTVDGSVATIPFGAWYYGTIIDQAKESSGDWGVFLLPGFEEDGNRASNLGGSSWMIPSAGKNTEEAYDFMEFFSTDPEVQNMAMSDYGLFPSLNTAYESELFTSGDEFFGGQKIWELFASEMENIPTAYYTQDYSLGLDESIKAQADVFNGKDVKQALEEAAKRLSDRSGREVNSY
ncbi:ABC transporter substrate-binding protein [Mangrovibacillus cuniculi]|uniref:Sugar ABC transporter substrate-binding protein n=1 Tax=Mangrovibacillus cuniculi TaxID=2593652 RepID=A0A7S8C8U8_9BACI|nr:sugar ABC transporter substrate-binding protein [Mangrovibacillus cuniculi]QPC45540.1 sugar ABC transporter substrate-binding protein [Mangrovibacillus cuniculi]